MFELTPFIRTNNFISAYDPFKEMEEFEKRFFERRVPTFKTDIRETDAAYILDAELPGFAKEDITAEVNGGYLTIRAEHKSENEKKDSKNNYIRRERSYGSYTRTFDLEGIKSEDITVAYKDGILTLNLPKAEQKKPEARRLEIK